MSWGLNLCDLGQLCNTLTSLVLKCESLSQITDAIIVTRGCPLSILFIILTTDQLAIFPIFTCHLSIQILYICISSCLCLSAIGKAQVLWQLATLLSIGQNTRMVHKPNWTFPFHCSQYINGPCTAICASCTYQLADLIVMIFLVVYHNAISDQMALQLHHFSCSMLWSCHTWFVNVLPEN